jgi:hypothetical protein
MHYCIVFIEDKDMLLFLLGEGRGSQKPNAIFCREVVEED